MFSHKVNDDIQLKLLELHDAEEIFAQTDESRNCLREWLPWVDSTKTVEDTRSFIKATLNQFASNNGFQTGIWYKGQLAGVIGFHRIDWPNRSTNIGYWLGKRFQGQGIMTNSVRALVDIAFGEYNLNRVEIRAAVENLKSRAIPERLGFRNEGCIRQSEWLYDHFVDHIVYGMLAQDWTGVKNSTG
ncbi:MAG: GNAT family N-acetyltransferase [Firmicutes bacterium]|nr:GNAT family N-acetyltransferase [Bacillota bacterium]